MAESVALERYRKDIVDVFNSYYDKLSSVLDGCIESFVKKAYAAQLISEQVMKDKNFTNVFSELKVGLELKSTEADMLKHCECVIKILEDLGGPAAIVGKYLAARLTDLPNLLNQYGLTYKDIDKHCDEGLFMDVSQHVDDYMKVGHGLNLPDEILTNISQNKKDDIERKIAIMWAWKRRNGSAATCTELVKVFLKLEDRSAAEYILKYLLKQKTIPHQSNFQFHLNPQKAKDRYPNWDDYTESEKEDVKNTLMDKNQEIREAYTVFFSQIMRSFIERKVNPMVIRSLANSYGQVLCEVFATSSKDDSIPTVFYEFSRHCTWFNYELLRVILKIEGNDVEKECLQTYEDDYLIPYLNLSIFEIPCTPSEDPSRTHLLFKVSADLCITGNQVKAIQRNLAKLLGFKHSTILHFEDYNEGCIELVFSIPTAVLNESLRFSPILTLIESEESRSCYKVTVDLLTVLSCSDTPEVSILCNMLQDALKQLNLKSKNEESEFERLLDPKVLRRKSIQIEHEQTKKLKEIINEKEELMNELMNTREEFVPVAMKKFPDKLRAIGQILKEMAFGSRSSSRRSSSQSRHSRPQQYMEPFSPTGPSSSTSSLEQNY